MDECVSCLVYNLNGTSIQSILSVVWTVFVIWTVNFQITGNRDTILNLWVTKRSANWSSFELLQFKILSCTVLLRTSLSLNMAYMTCSSHHFLYKKNLNTGLCVVGMMTSPPLLLNLRCAPYKYLAELSIHCIATKSEKGI